MSTQLILQQNWSDPILDIVVNLMIAFLLQKKHRRIMINLTQIALRQVLFILTFSSSFLTLTFLLLIRIWVKVHDSSFKILFSQLK